MPPVSHLEMALIGICIALSVICFALFIMRILDSHRIDSIAVDLWETKQANKKLAVTIGLVNDRMAIFDRFKGDMQADKKDGALEQMNEESTE